MESIPYDDVLAPKMTRGTGPIRGFQARGQARRHRRVGGKMDEHCEGDYPCRINKLEIMHAYGPSEGTGAGARPFRIANRIQWKDRPP